MAEADKESELQEFNDWVDKGIERGIQFNLEKITTEQGIKAGVKEPEQYYAPDTPPMGAGMGAEGTQVPPMGQTGQTPPQPPMSPPQNA
jgi:hypothetical protein